MLISLSKYNHDCFLFPPAVTKKPTKDTLRWQPEHHPTEDHTLSNHTHRHTDDGGWSTGIPTKGSGWRKTTPINESSHKETCQSRDNQTIKNVSSGSWGNGQSTSDSSVGVESWSQDSSNKLKSESETWGRNDAGGWSSDQDGGSSRSQSPGGLVMVVKQVETSTPSKDDGTVIWHSKPVGSNWKMHTLDTKAPESSPEEGDSHGSGRGIRDGDWEDLDAVSLSSNERDTTSLFDRENVCLKTNSSDDGGEATSGDTNSDPDRYRGGSSQETGNELNSRSVIQSGSSTPGNATPTHEMGGAWRSGRTSVGSTSSLSEVNSSGVKGGIKGNQPIRSTSPRKMNRYACMNSSSKMEL